MKINNYQGRVLIETKINFSAEYYERNNKIIEQTIKLRSEQSNSYSMINNRYKYIKLTLLLILLSGIN